MLARLLPLAQASLCVAAVCLATPVLAQGKARQAQPPQSNPNAPPTAPKKFPTDLQWTLVGFTNHTVPGDRPTLMIDGQFRARGFGGCNAFSATAIPQPGQRFAVGPIAQTKKSCGKGIDDLERAFLIAFRTTVAWDLRDGFLLFGGQAGELKFERGL